MPRPNALATFLTLLATLSVGTPRPRIVVSPHAVAPRVDITVDGAPFTSYLFERSRKAPTLFPLRTAGGTVVTRGYPTAPRAKERVDHSPHVGLWFNYGDVNGLDFWNSSDAVPPARAAMVGRIVHKRVIEAFSGDERGELNVELDWVDPGGRALMKEITRFVFRGDPERRSIDRITRLSALVEPVVLGDHQDGLLGIRVARGLEAPSKGPGAFTDASGTSMNARSLENEGQSGSHESSDGSTGKAMWGRRGPWALLQGQVEGERVTLGILDHPGNPGHPPYWHARGDGLFAVNNLGRTVSEPAKPGGRLTLNPGESVTFRHRVLILSGTADAARMTAESRTFAGDD